MSSQGLETAICYIDYNLSIVIMEYLLVWILLFLAIDDKEPFMIAAFLDDCDFIRIVK